MIRLIVKKSTLFTSFLVMHVYNTIPEWPLPLDPVNSLNTLVSHKAKKKSCLVVLNCLPLIFENWKKIFTVQKYTAPNFQNSKKGFFFFENFDLLIFSKLLLSTCLHFNTGLELVKKKSRLICTFIGI